MKEYVLIIKTDTVTEHIVNEYSNNDRRIRFFDEITGELHNYPEHWVAIITKGETNNG